ncbi:hypothetical protein B0H13DRAFT_2371830 [Mycena leptocephala]|nr:hypothetical protein B0H13DRAFT_2371830 [Mycena leptocephala]
MASLTLTYGPLLFGGAAALILSGIVSVQCLIYFKSYSQRGIKKATVLVVWILDVLQSAFILASLCHYFVTHFGDTSVLAVIPWSVALTILVTVRAIQTWIVHLFYARTIHRSSGKNWVITSPVVLFATLQLLAGLITSIQLWLLLSPIQSALITYDHQG